MLASDIKQISLRLLKTCKNFLHSNFLLFKNGFLRNISLVAISRGLVRIKGLIIAPLIISALGKEGYGMWIQALVTINLVASLSEMNLHSSLVRFGAGAKDKKGLTNIFFQTFSLGFLFSIISGLAIIFLATPLATGILKNPATENLIKIGAGLVVIRVSTKICQTLFRTQEQFKKYASVTVAVAVLEIIGVFLGLRIVKDPVAVILGVSAGNLIVVLVLIFYILIKLDFSAVHLVRSDVARFLKLSIPGLPILLAEWVFTYVDRYFLSFYRTAGEVGIYSLAYTLGGLPLFLLSPLATVLLPSLSRLWDEKKYFECRKVLYSSIMFYLSLGIVFWLIILIFAKPFLSFISTQAEFGIRGRWITPIVGLGVLAYAVFYLLSYVFYLVEKSYYIMLIFSIGALVNFTANLWAVPRFGSLGAAVTTLISHTVMLIITVTASMRLIKSRDGSNL